jgi:carbon-monoxide dehydrogenase large subunit
VAPEVVTVVHSDTALVPRGEGTMASRSLQVGGSAVLQAAEQVLDKARTLAAHLLEVQVDGVAVFPGEGLGVAGAPGTAVPWREPAAAAADFKLHGGVAQGAAQALYEEVRSDQQGNCLTGSLVSYAMPSAADLPAFETLRTETPSPLNPLGAKGIGESGAIGATPAVQNAVVDALRHLGVTHVDMPLTPERVWRGIRAADPPET